MLTDRRAFGPSARRCFRDFDAWRAGLQGAAPGADFLRAALPARELAAKSRCYRREIAAAAAALRAKPSADFWATIARIENASFHYLLTGEPKALSWALAGLEVLEAWKDRYFTYHVNLRAGTEMDLWTAAAVKAMGIMRAAFDPVMDDEVRARLRRTALDRVLRPALEALRVRRYWWSEAKHNWRSVMTGSFAIGAMAFCEEFEEWAEVVEYGVEGILTILDLGDPEGGWNEGPGYWEYGIVHCAEPAFLLRAMSRGRVDLFRHPFLRRTGDFRAHMTAWPGRIWNWSDCGKGASPSICLAILARVCRDRGWQRVVEREGISGLKMFGYFDPSLPAASARGAAPAKVFPSIGVVAMRSGFGRGDEFVGFKAGSVAREINHCHLDLGSLVIFVGPDELLAETENWPYAQVMTRRKPPFGNSRAGGCNDSAPDGRRWNFDGYAGIGHNLPVIGADYPRRVFGATARITQCDLGVEKSLLAVDLTPYYRPIARRVRRYLAYLPPGVIVLVDELRADEKLKARVLYHFLDGAEPDVDRFTIRRGAAELTVASLCPSREHNVVLGIDRRSSAYNTENGQVRVGNSFVYVENFHRDKRMVFVSALCFGRRPLNAPEVRLFGDPFEQDRFAVQVKRGRKSSRITLDLRKGTIRCHGRGEGR
ncbi:MAG TPA: heparinase II/III family protein [Planctomycetota bacterium]|nr:heparinase II/III family protein [Planctomycetota bacterium]